jgi:hypothetical protein
MRESRSATRFSAGNAAFLYGALLAALPEPERAARGDEVELPAAAPLPGIAGALALEVPDGEEGLFDM